MMTENSAQSVLSVSDDGASKKEAAAEALLPWDFRKKVAEFQRPGVRLLELQSERRSPRLSERLSELGSSAKYDFPDCSFDLVINRYGSFNLSEVKRVLRTGGHFITEQVGALEAPDSLPPEYNLENEAERFRKNGFKIVFREQFYSEPFCSDSDSAGSRQIHRFMIIAKYKGG